MFRRSKSQVLVDYAAEEDDMSWHYRHSYKDKDIQGEEEEEEAVTAVSKEAKVKKIMSKKEKKEKKMSSKDDEHFLLTGVKLADRRGSHKKIKDDEKEKDKKEKPDKGHCFWESVTMTMRQISPVKKLEKIDGWETPQPHRNSSETDAAPKEEAEEDKTPNGDLTVPVPDSLDLPLELATWAGLEEDSSRYANLSDSKDPTCAVRWTARAKVKLAGISRMSRGMVSESAWEGLK
uniref:testis development-related protein n=1 Tax=Doryrhamphus excisus TaxID=161450 RepID=UPI0025AE3C1B|nr:testis development-related protein [Doryrhamphus excisus]